MCLNFFELDLGALFLEIAVRKYLVAGNNLLAAIIFYNVLVPIVLRRGGLIEVNTPEGRCKIRHHQLQIIQR